MKLLSKLTPVETILLTDSSYDLKKMMKYTFTDLLLKKVIAIKVEDRKVTKIDEEGRGVEVVETDKYVICGKNHTNYTPKEHEKFFLLSFNNPAEFRILFHHFITMAYENAKGFTTFKKAVLKSKDLDGLLKANVIQRPFGYYSFIRAGKKAQQDILVLCQITIVWCLRRIL